MPRDPRDISLSAPERQTRRLMENEEAAQGGSRVFGQAPAGAEGKEGKAGATWYSGTTVPSTGLGAVGDFYLRTTTDDVYKKTGEAIWSLEVNIKGSTGSTGATGSEGPAGSATMNGYKEPCRVATTANITISTALNPGDVLDGVTLAENDRVLVKNQTTKSENGIWRVAAVPARTTDANTAGALRGGTVVYIESGTKNAERVFRITTDGSITPGTTAHTWEELPSKRRIVGAVSAAGAILNGEGFSITNPATGEYKIALTTELPSAATMLVTLNGSFTQVFKVTGPSKKEWTLNINGFNFAVPKMEAANEAFSFEVIEI